MAIWVTVAAVCLFAMLPRGQGLACDAGTEAAGGSLRDIVKLSSSVSYSGTAFTAIIGIDLILRPQYAKLGHSPEATGERRLSQRT